MSDKFLGVPISKYDIEDLLDQEGKISKAAIAKALRHESHGSQQRTKHSWVEEKQDFRPQKYATSKTDRSAARSITLKDIVDDKDVDHFIQTGKLSLTKGIMQQGLYSGPSPSSEGTSAIITPLDMGTSIGEKILLSMGYNTNTRVCIPRNKHSLPPALRDILREIKRKEQSMLDSLGTLSASNDAPPSATPQEEEKRSIGMQLPISIRIEKSVQEWEEFEKNLAKSSKRRHRLIKDAEDMEKDFEKLLVWREPRRGVGYTAHDQDNLDEFGNDRREKATKRAHEYGLPTTKKAHALNAFNDYEDIDMHSSYKHKGYLRELSVYDEEDVASIDRRALLKGSLSSAPVDKAAFFQSSSLTKIRFESSTQKVSLKSSDIKNLSSSALRVPSWFGEKHSFTSEDVSLETNGSYRLLQKFMMDRRRLTVRKTYQDYFKSVSKPVTSDESDRKIGSEVPLWNTIDEKARENVLKNILTRKSEFTSGPSANKKEEILNNVWYLYKYDREKQVRFESFVAAKEGKLRNIVLQNMQEKALGIRGAQDEKEEFATQYFALKEAHKIVSFPLYETEIFNIAPSMRRTVNWRPAPALLKLVRIKDPWLGREFTETTSDTAGFREEEKPPEEFVTLPSDNAQIYSYSAMLPPGIQSAETEEDASQPRESAKASDGNISLTVEKKEDVEVDLMKCELVNNRPPQSIFRAVFDSDSEED